MTNRIYIYAFAVLGVIAMTVQSCVNDSILEDPGAKLEFSLDTLTFDTVFTAIGSTTRSFKVYNRNEKTVNISKVELAGIAGDAFRLNIDGSTGNVLTDITIPSNDSIYIFAEVTVDPNDLTNPYVITDEVRFEINGNEQKVTLEAWGQNANYIGGKGFVSGCTTDLFFTDEKPYVIYGILVIDNCELTLPPGCQIYVHGGLVNQDTSYYSDGLIYIGEMVD
ncbi:MAG: hypothetical protein HC803_07120 [Saprospiraceae bacterium]|nr:hypothetical protein [Saprospiraceae bacterium]